MFQQQQLIFNWIIRAAISSLRSQTIGVGCLCKAMKVPLSFMTWCLSSLGCDCNPSVFQVQTWHIFLVYFRWHEHICGLSANDFISLTVQVISVISKRCSRGYTVLVCVQYLVFSNVCLRFRVWVGRDWFLTTVWFKLKIEDSVGLKLHFQ